MTCDVCTGALQRGKFRVIYAPYEVLVVCARCEAKLARFPVVTRPQMVVWWAKLWGRPE